MFELVQPKPLSRRQQRLKDFRDNKAHSRALSAALRDGLGEHKWHISVVWTERQRIADQKRNRKDGRNGRCRTL